MIRLTPVAAYDDVLEELHSLRRARARNAVDFRTTPHLVWHLGRGSIDTAQRFFVALRDFNDDEVQAALASLGFYSYARTVEDRMAEFAVERELKTTRTVRRWTEDGFEKIAHLIMEWSEEEGNESAVLEILLHREPTQGGLQVHLSGSGAPSMKMLEPIVKANHEEIELDLDDLPSDGEVERLLFSSSFELPVPTTKELRPMLEVLWPGNTQVGYEVQVHPSIRDYVTRATVTKKGCEIHLVNSADFLVPKAIDAHRDNAHD